MSTGLAKPNRANVFGAKSHSVHFSLVFFFWFFSLHFVLYGFLVWYFFLDRTAIVFGSFKFDFVIYFNPTLAQISFHNLVFVVFPMGDLRIAVDLIC